MTRSIDSVANWRRHLSIAAGVAVVHGLAVALERVFSPECPSLFWPPAALVLAAAVWFGPWAYPGLFLATWLVTSWSDAPPLAAGGMAIGQVLAAAAGRRIFQSASRRPRFDQIQDMWLLVLAATVGPALAATCGLLGCWAAGLLPLAALANSWPIWWAGDAVAVLLLTPLLLLPPYRRPFDALWGSRLLAWVGMLVGTGVALGFFLASDHSPLALIVGELPVLVILSARYGPLGAAAANAGMTLTVLPMLLTGRLPLDPLLIEPVLAVVAVTNLCLGAVTAERDAAVARMASDLAARQAAEARRAEAEAALAADRARFAALLQHSHDAILVLSADGQIRFISPAAGRATGRTAADLTGNSAFDEVHPEDLLAVRQTFAECLAQPGSTYRAEFRVRTATGGWVWFEAIGTNRTDDPHVGGVVVNMRDVTERRNYEERLAAARELLEMTGRVAGIGGWDYVIPEDRLSWTEQTYRIHEVSPAEYTPTVASAITFYLPEARATIRRAVETSVRTGQGWDLVLPFETARGRRLWVHAVGKVEHRDGRPYRLYGTIQDVTERVENERAVRRLEEQVRQAQKMEAVARLAGGIAHDFNNLLTIINGFGELLAQETAPGSTARELVGHILDAGRRAADLTRQLLTFGRRRPPAAAVIDLTHVVRGLQPLLLPLLGDAIRLVLQLDPVSLVRADAGQIEQVVMNLCLNARDAMPDGGTLTVSTGMVELTDTTPDHASAAIPAGRWVVLSVRDTGRGIPEEARPHLFEPFFTTKDVGRGTGLGLSTVYAITTAAGGFVRYETVVGEGTVFHVYLPPVSDAERLAAGPPGESAVLVAPAVAAPAESILPPGSDGEANRPVVLLVEDQIGVRELACRGLAAAGFVVLTACDGQDALERLAASPRPPDVLITDVMMPRLNGRELARRVRESHPAVRVLFVSGYSPDEWVPVGEAFLSKPFAMEDLVAAVRSLLREAVAP